MGNMKDDITVDDQLDNNNHQIAGGVTIP